MMGSLYGLCGGIGGWGWLAWLLGLGLFFGLVAVLVSLLVTLWRRSSSPHARAPKSDRSAREILEIRYARGELSREDFRRMTEDLGQSDK